MQLSKLWIPRAACIAQKTDVKTQLEKIKKKGIKIGKTAVLKIGLLAQQKFSFNWNFHITRTPRFKVRFFERKSASLKKIQSCSSLKAWFLKLIFI